MKRFEKHNTPRLQTWHYMFANDTLYDWHRNTMRLSM